MAKSKLSTIHFSPVTKKVTKVVIEVGSMTRKTVKQEDGTEKVEREYKFEQSFTHYLPMVDGAVSDLLKAYAHDYPGKVVDIVEQYEALLSLSFDSYALYAEEKEVPKNRQ